MGFNFPHEWDEIQKVVGFCPQHSILYPDLTTKEHLTFYGRLKGAIRRRDIDEDVQR